MIFFRLNPFARIFLPFIFGIILTYFLFIPYWVLAILFLGSLLGIPSSYLICLKNDSRYIRIVFGLFISLLFLLIGAFHFQKTNQNSKSNVDLVKRIGAGDDLRIFRTKSAPKFKNHTCKVNMEWILVSTGQKINGIAYFKDSNNLPELGDVISISNELEAFSNPTNPGQFNYASYANGNDLYFSVFVDNWYNSELEIPLTLKDKFSALREYLLGIIGLYIHGDEFSISSALVFGEKASLSPEIKEAYSGAGAMHVLAVSGLHVGLVYLFLKYLLSFLNRTRKSQILKTLIIIALIFIYAGITGFSPSVTRASFMFSLIAVSGLLRRSSSIYNIIFVSAFGMLLYDPRLLFSVSFQLSYIAVIGIIFLYPRLFLLWNPKTWLTYNIWSLVCLSFAAQVATFALALYYFKLFPTWFLLTNLIVVPGAMVELGSGFVLIASHFVGLGEWVGWLCGNIIWAINQAVLFIDAIPPGPLQISFNGLQLFFSYLFIGFLFLLIDFPKKRNLYPVMGVFVVLLSSFGQEKIKTQLQKGIIVYDSKNTMVEIYFGDKSIIYMDTTFHKIEEDLKYIIEPSLKLRNMTNYNLAPINLDSLGSLTYQINNKKYKIPVKDLDVKELVSNSQVEVYILTSSIKPNVFRKWKSTLDSLEIQYWDIRKQGYFSEMHEGF